MNEFAGWVLKFVLSAWRPRVLIPEIESGTRSCVSVPASWSDAPVRLAIFRASADGSRTLRRSRIAVGARDGIPSRSTMSSAGVTPPIIDGPNENP